MLTAAAISYFNEVQNHHENCLSKRLHLSLVLLISFPDLPIGNVRFFSFSITLSNLTVKKGLFLSSELNAILSLVGKDSVVEEAHRNLPPPFDLGEFRGFNH